MNTGADTLVDRGASFWEQLWFGLYVGWWSVGGAVFGFLVGAEAFQNNNNPLVYATLVSLLCLPGVGWLAFAVRAKKWLQWTVTIVGVVGLCGSGYGMINVYHQMQEITINSVTVAVAAISIAFLGAGLIACLFAIGVSFFIASAGAFGLQYCICTGSRPTRGPQGS